jgi:hypothetical protein
LPAASVPAATREQEGQRAPAFQQTQALHQALRMGMAAPGGRADAAHVGARAGDRTGTAARDGLGTPHAGPGPTAAARTPTGTVAVAIVPIKPPDLGIARCSVASSGGSSPYSPCSLRCAWVRVAPVPLRALDPPCAPGTAERRSAPKNGLFVPPKNGCLTSHSVSGNRGAARYVDALIGTLQGVIDAAKLNRRFCQSLP